MSASVAPGPRAAAGLIGSVSVSALGDGFRYAALPLLVTTYGGSALMVGLLLALGTTPFLLFGVFGGALVDRLDAIRLLRVTELTRGCAVLAFAMLIAAGASHSTVVVAALVIAFVMGTGEAVSFPAIFAVTPAVVPPDRLVSVNGRISALETLGKQFAGPLIGAALLVAVAPGPFLIDAATFFASWALLRLLLPARLTPGEAQPPVTLLRSVADGFTWLRGQPLLLAFSVASALINLGNMGFLATEAVYVIRGLHSSAFGYGVMMSFAALGAAATAALADRVAGRLASVGATVLATLVVSGGMAVIATAPALPVACVGSLLSGGGFALYNVTVTTLRQRLTPPQWRGRADSLYRLVSWGALPLGSLLGGALAAGVGSRAPATLTVLTTAAAALWLLRTGRHHARVEPRLRDGELTTS